mgnify:FL=1|tara:strand:- start:763 stop:1350 length:588 start_codon:yes stop_codon:yes gene_type:complete
MPFLSEKAKSTVSAGAGGGYLNPSKIQSGTSVRFSLLSDSPLEFWEVWGEAVDNSRKPFRFESQPTPEDVEAAMGANYFRRKGQDGETPEPAKFALAVPVFNHDAGLVQVLSIVQKSIARELDAISQLEEYSDLLSIDFQLNKEGNGLNTEYGLRPLPRKKGSQESIDEAWSEAKKEGFDITRLMTGGNPFKEDV